MRRDFVRLVRLIAPYWKSMLLAIVIGFLTVASSIGLMAASAILIASAAMHPPVLDLMLLIVGVRFFGISRGVFRYLERYITHDVTFRILSRLRVWFYTKLEPLAPAVLMDYRSGELFSRIVADVETLKEFYLRVLAPPLVALMVLAGVFIFLARFGFKLALVFLMFYILAGVGIPLIVKSLSLGLGRRMVEVRSLLSSHLVDSIKGMTEILAFAQTGRQLKQVEELSREFLGIQRRVAGFTGFSAALTGLAMNLALWSILVLVIPLVAQGRLDGIYLAMLALVTQSSFEAVLSLPSVFQHLEHSLAAARRLFEIIDNKTVAAQDSSGLSPKPNSYELKVEGLRFRYAADEPLSLDGLDFVLPEGGRMAIVGPSGAGKSTLVNLLLRFWDYEEGLILLGGHELKSYSREEIRDMIGVVTQHTHLFNATVRENLLIAKPGAREEELVQVAREAQIHEFIQSLPRGYDTYIGEGGYKLSGGQRQRLAIARVLLKNSPILVLDEATLGLDPVTEREVMEGIYRLMKGRTTLVITHRLAGLEKMDEILVLKEGRVAEQGQHQELLRQDGIYRGMWELQHQVFGDI